MTKNPFPLMNAFSMTSSKFSAVALKYPQNVEAPLIVAKEKGLLAERMVQIAEENGVPVVEDSLTENVLSVAEIGDCIPESTWQAVAGIFAMIQKLEGKKER